MLAAEPTASLARVARASRSERQHADVDRDADHGAGQHPDDGADAAVAADGPATNHTTSAISNDASTIRPRLAKMGRSA